MSVERLIGLMLTKETNPRLSPLGLFTLAVCGGGAADGGSISVYDTFNLSFGKQPALTVSKAVQDNT